MYDILNYIVDFKQEAIALADIVDAIRLAHLELILIFCFFPSLLFRHPAFAASCCCISKHDTRTF